MNAHGLFRVLDANFNRLREGVRVLEEVQRLVLNHASSTRHLKRLRHQISAAYRELSRKQLFSARESEGDVGRRSRLASETRRSSLSDLVEANCKRCQEAARVIEEFSKLENVGVSARAKEIRFQLYTIEKLFFNKVLKQEAGNGRRT